MYESQTPPFAFSRSAVRFMKITTKRVYFFSTFFTSFFAPFVAALTFFSTFFTAAFGFLAAGAFLVVDALVGLAATAFFSLGAAFGAAFFLVTPAPVSADFFFGAAAFFLDTVGFGASTVWNTRG